MEIEGFGVCWEHLHEDEAHLISRTSFADIDFANYWEQAKVRWLRPNEIYDILCNFKKFKIWTEPPNLPPSGTLILFNRKILRNFRRDGHVWQKKKDNKTIKEAHEHLKVGGEEKIHVYYAHGDNNSNFQRRVYWLLDKKLEHIVLVHYLQVKEGNRGTVQPAEGNLGEVSQHIIQPGQGLIPNIVQSGARNLKCLTLDLAPEFEYDDCDTFSLEELESYTITEESGSGTVETGQTQRISDSGNVFGDGMSYVTNPTSIIQHMQYSGNSSYYAGLFGGSNDSVYNREELKLQSNNPDLREDIVTNDTYSIKEESNQNENGFDAVDGGNMHAPVANSKCLSTAKEGGHLHTLCDLPSTLSIPEKIIGKCDCPVMSQIDDEKDAYVRKQQQQQWELKKNINSQNIQTTVESTECSQVKPPEVSDAIPLSFADDAGFLKDLETMDSLGRWILHNFPSNSHGSCLPVSVDSTSYNALNMQVEDQCMAEGTSSLAQQYPVAEEPAPSISQQFLFNITEFSPMWGFSSEKTKVVITGIFMGEAVDFKKYQWCCVFNETEVPAEVVQVGVLKCTAPPHTPGHVPTFLTCGDGQACSEARDFEYRADANSLRGSHSLQKESQSGDDDVLKVRLARLLLSSCKGTSVMCANVDSSANNLCGSFKYTIPVTDKQWESMENYVLQHPTEVTECLLQVLFKYKLRDWLLSELQAGGRGLFALHKHGQGVIHLAAALGYDWAIAPILAAGVSINFRDKNGWTPLHWAAAYGREKMVGALLAAGASARMVSDPNPKCPSGLTPADFAAHAGYDGIAAYLSESDLVTHLSSLTLSENEYDKQAAAQEGSRVVEYLKRSSSLSKTVKTLEDKLSLHDSLLAVRNVTEASARIHAAFREYSLREHFLAIEEVDEYGLTSLEAKAILAEKKNHKAYKNHRERKLQEYAALRIQNKFRGWKRRKDFLFIRQQVVKIQACYRMHRARKQYQRILWSVGILEKAILRWKQKKKGLRGYNAQPIIPFEGCENDDSFEIDRRHVEESIERSVVRVQAMVRSHQARQEYHRMVETCKEAEAG